jgi:hypothetical protein
VTNGGKYISPEGTSDKAIKQDIPDHFVPGATNPGNGS